MKTAHVSPAQEQLTRALITLASHGKRPRCGDPETHTYWLSDDTDDRATAATWCAGCPVLDLCGAAAEAVGERFGVWGGIDRTPNQAKQVRTAA